MGAKQALEVGVFTGYSSLAVALALPPDGRLIACDVNDTWTTIAQEYWHAAGIAKKIELRLAPAEDTLAALLATNQAGTFDFAFIDADKGNYIKYFEQIFELLRPGGLIAIDNVLWDGKVADSDNQQESTRAIHAFNEHLFNDNRITLSMLPIGDGLSLAMKR